MRILIVDNYYPEFLETIEKQIVNAGVYRYEEVKQRIIDAKFGTSDYYSRNLRTLGVEAEDIIINSKLLQKIWAKEHNYLLYLSCLILENLPKIKDVYRHVGNPLVLLAQIRGNNPDVVYVQCIGALPPILTRLMKSQCKRLVGQIASMFPPKSYFLNYDLVLSSLPNMVARLRKIGVNSEYFAIGFESTVLDKLEKNVKTIYDVTHVGGYGPIHNERNKVMEYAASKTNIDFWGYGIGNLNKNSVIKKTYHGQSWGLEMYQILKQSKITLTGHITKVAGKYANNMTLFEATGCGALLITDHKSNLNELFEIDKEIVTYRSPSELVKKIKYYLKHEDERRKIALAGQKRTLRDHTYLNRMKELKIILEKL